MDVEVTSRSGPARCAVCHDELASPAAPCDGCGTVLHAECREAVHGCPTIGCRNRVVPVVVTESQGDRERARARRLGVVALFNGVAALYMAWRCEALIEGAPPTASLSSSPAPFTVAGSVLLAVITLLLAAATWRRAWLGVGALCLAVAWIGVTGPQLTTLLAWSAPLSEVEAREFAGQLERRDEHALGRVDVDAMVAKHDPTHGALTVLERESLQEQFRREHLATRPSDFEIVHVRAGAEPTLIARRLDPDSDLNYEELVLARGRDGHPTCIEVVEVRTNDTWAGGHVRAGNTPRRTRDALSRIFNLADAGDPEAAHAVFDELQEPERSDRDVLLARLLAARHLDAERHAAALESVIAACPGELEILRWELASVREDHGATLLSLDAIDRRVGGDPLLDALRADVLSAQGQLAQAVELAARATEAVPDVELAWWVLLGCAVEANDHPRTRAALERLVGALEWPLEDVERAVDLTNFFASEDGEKWRLRSR